MTSARDIADAHELIYAIGRGMSFYEAVIDAPALCHPYTLAELSAAEMSDQLICPECLADLQDLL